MEVMRYAQDESYAPCSSPLAPCPFSLPLSGGSRRGAFQGELEGGLEAFVRIFQRCSPDVPFCVSKAMLLRAKRYAFGVQKGTF